MSIEEIKTLKHAKPFRPFDIVMTDGRIVHVVEPYCMALSPTGKTVAVYEGSGGPTFLQVRRMEALRVPGLKQEESTRD